MLLQSQHSHSTDLSLTLTFVPNNIPVSCALVLSSYRILEAYAAPSSVQGANMCSVASYGS